MKPVWRAVSILAMSVGFADAATALDTLAENHAKWKSQRPPRYAFTYRVECGRSCLPPVWRVIVEGDSVKQVTDIGGQGRPPEPNFNPQSLLMDSIFADTKAQLESRTSAHDILYNARLGYPELVHFNAVVINDGFNAYITDFTDAAASIRNSPPSPAAPGGMNSDRDLAGRRIRKPGAAPVFAYPR